MQILMNLLSNAVKFTPANGVVELNAFETASDIVFVITDTGLGMDEKSLSSLGTPFFQAKSVNMAPSGTGLGVSIVKALIKECRGSIDYESSLGVGTKVTVRLPKGAIETPIAPEV